MNTEQGVDVHAYVFENMTLITQARLSSVVARAIGTYIPEAAILNIVGSVRKNADGTESTLVIETQYRVGNQTVDQQVPIPLDQLTTGGP
jgi:phage baseplate assembly protein W